MHKIYGGVAMINSKNLHTYSPKERNMYLMGLFGQNIIYNIIGASLAYYLQFTILIPAIAVSTIMAIARVWDAFNDPMMGSIVDRTRSKWGKCRPYLLFVPIPVFIVTMMCFINFGFYDPAAGAANGHNILVVGWAAFAYILWGMVYTVGDIPLWGITALMTEDQNDRTKLLSLARIVAGIGAGITLLAIQPLALALGEKFTPVFDSAPEGERMGFITAALLFGVVGTITFQMAGLFTKEHIAPSEEKYTLKENFALMWKNKPFRQILISGLLSSTIQLPMLVAMPIVTYYYASKDPIMALLYMVLLGGGLFIGQFVAMGASPWLTKKFSKKNLYNYCHLLSAVPFALLFVLYLSAPSKLVEPMYLAISLVLFVICGGAIGLISVLRSLMIADAVDYEEYQSGIRPDGVFFSGQSFITKLSMGIATVISGIAYSAVGFSDARVQEVNAFIEAGGIPRENPEYAPYLMILFFLISIPPAIGCLLAVIPTWKYALDDDEHNRILEILNKRRHEKEDSEESAE